MTLSVTPTDAERIALAATEGQIVLALRNPLDAEPSATSGVRMAELMPATPTRRRRRLPRSQAVRKAIRRPPPPPAPRSQRSTIYKVEAIRASKRSEETVR